MFQSFYHKECDSISVDLNQAIFKLDIYTGSNNSEYILIC